MSVGETRKILLVSFGISVRVNSSRVTYHRAFCHRLDIQTVNKKRYVNEVKYILNRSVDQLYTFWYDPPYNCHAIFYLLGVCPADVENAVHNTYSGKAIVVFSDYDSIFLLTTYKNPSMQSMLFQFFIVISAYTSRCLLNLFVHMGIYSVSY